MAKSKKNKGHHGHHPARKNPLGQPLMNLVKKVGAGAVGLLADAYIPAWILGMMGKPDIGWLSYLIAAGVVLIPTYALQKAGMSVASEAYLIGSGAGFAWRVIDAVTGQQYVQVQTGMGSFLIPANPPLPGPNVFPAGRNMIGLPAMSGTTGAGTAGSTMAVSKPAGGMKYFMSA